MTSASQPLLSASQLELASKCSGAFAHDHISTTTPSAERGTAIHAHIAALLKGETPTLPGQESTATTCRNLDREQLMDAARPESSSALYIEKALYFHPPTAQADLLDAAYHRDYSAAPAGSIPGTADAISVESARVLITDWKSGAREVTNPAENPQLRLLALAAARAFERQSATVQIGYINENGDLRLLSADLDEADLELIEAQVSRVSKQVQAARDGDPVYQPGSQCRVCSAIASCPAIAGAAQALTEGPPQELTPELVGGLWSQLQAVEAAAKRTREALHEYVYAREVPTTSGKVLKVIETRRENIDSSKAFDILREHLPDEALAEAVAVTKTSLSGALDKETQGKLLVEFKEAGALHETHSESLREVRS